MAGNQDPAAAKALHDREDEIEEARQRIATFFGKGEPKNVAEGLVKALESVGKGVFAGVAGVVASPVIGAQKQGGIGFAKGAAMGLAGLVLFPVAGLVHGSVQLGVGIKNTPEAVRTMMHNTTPEEVAAEKAELTSPDSMAIVKDQNLYTEARKRVMEAALLLNRSQPPPSPQTDKFSGPAAPQKAAAPSEEPEQKTKFVKESTLYEVLEVSSNATPAEIKKAYYKLARDLHPDKNHGDARATERFQALGEAYQVLMDPEQREKYDRHGAAGLEDNWMDAGAFFTMAFGGEKFRPLVGVLTVAFTAAGDVTDEKLKEFQASREQKLAELLKLRLEAWVGGEKEKFIAAALEQVEQLRLEPFSQAMLRCIGYTYFHKAQVLLGLHHTPTGIPGYLLALRESGHGFKTKYKAVSAALKMEGLQQRMAQEDPAEKERSAAEALPIFLDSIWLVTVLDIESTLRHVVEAVVLDAGASREVRKARARGLLKLGKVFQQA